MQDDNVLNRLGWLKKHYHGVTTMNEFEKNAEKAKADAAKTDVAARQNANIHAANPFDGTVEVDNGAVPVVETKSFRTYERECFDLTDDLKTAQEADIEASSSTDVNVEKAKVEATAKAKADADAKTKADLKK